MVYILNNKQSPKMIRINIDLLNDRGINSSNYTLNDCIEDNNNFRNIINVNVNNTILPINPPFEIHPYSNLIDYNNEYDSYIVGTFPPISYLYDSCPNIKNLRKSLGERRIPNPQFPFFHGNKNLMWDYLLTPNEMNNLNQLQRDLKPSYLIHLLNQININYGDLIEYCQRESDYNANDSNLYNIIINDRLVNSIFKNKRAKFLLFNTSSIYNISGIKLNNFGFIDIDNSISAFDLFLYHLQNNGLEIEFRINNGFVCFPWTPLQQLPINLKSHKLAFEIKVKNVNNANNNCLLDIDEERIYTICTPLSPAVAHRYPNNLAVNPLIANWQINNPGLLPKDFLYNIYQDFRNRNWTNIYNLNQ
jgi:hypothetical protein